MQLRHHRKITKKIIILRHCTAFSTDCALKLERDEADFGIFTAEEAILASKFDTKQQLVVIGDIRDSKEDKNGKKLFLKRFDRFCSNQLK